MCVCVCVCVFVCVSVCLSINRRDWRTEPLCFFGKRTALIPQMTVVFPCFTSADPSAVVIDPGKQKEAALIRHSAEYTRRL